MPLPPNYVQAHHFPMSGHGVLAVAGLLQNHPAAQGLGLRLQAVQGAQVAEAQPPQAGDVQARCFRDMAQRVGALVAEFFRVRHSADPQRVYHDKKNPLILIHNHYYTIDRKSVV